ncbi:MAG: histidine kinase [Bacteroidetes bacterium]|nr:histidine kinase [Bacteroidota bacterium]
MEKRALVILTCFVVILNSNTSAQFIQSIDKKTIDSLEVLLPGLEGQEKIDLFNQLGELYAWYNPEKSELYSNEALESSIKTDYHIGRGAALYNIGYRKYFEGDPAGAIDYFQRAIDAIDSTSSFYMLGKIYEKYSIALFQDGSDKEKGLEYLLSCIQLYQAAGDKKAESTIYLIASGGFFRINQPQKGLEYINKYWDLIKESGTPNLNLAISYAVAAACYIRLGDLKKAIEFNKKSIDQFDESVFEEMSLKSQLEFIQGTFYFIAQQTDSARKYYYLSLEHSKPNGNAYNMMMAYYHLANLNFSISEIETSRKYCDSAMKAASFIDSTGGFYFQDTLKHCIAMSEDIFFPLSKSHRRYYAWETMNNCYKILWDGYLKTNDLIQAVQIQESWMAVRDRIYTYKRNKDILELNVSHETEKKEHELARLSKDNEFKEERLKQSYWIVASLVMLVILIVFLAVVLIRQNKLRNHQHTLLLQQRLLRTQMNPHFLFNSLASIQNFIIKEKPALASDYLSRFSKLVRQILNNSVEEWVPLEDEIESIKNYLELQKVRHRDMFDYSIDVDEAIDPETIQVPPMLAQPFIENSIEHGFKQKSGKGHLKIQFKKNGKLIRFELEDDGIGREKAMKIVAEQNKDHRSMSSEITRQRLKVLSKKTRQKINLSIIDLKDEKRNPVGTKVAFDIPFRN